MIEAPTGLTQLDVVWGNIKYLPKWEDIPEEFRDFRGNKCTIMASDWFFGQLKELPKVKPGLDETQVYAALRSILVSFEPKHEHKEAGVGYLISQWCIVE